MPARTPEDVAALFVQHFTSRDLDALVALYEPQAVLVPEPGKVVRGHEGIRAALAGFLALGGRFHMATPHAIHGEGIAVLYAGWTLDARAPDGSPIALAGQATDVVRRQPDGRWLYAIDSPFGAAGTG